MNQCEGFTNANGGAQCSHRGRDEIDGFHFCKTHLRIYNTARAQAGAARPLDRCHVISRLHSFCPNNCHPGHLRCQRHLPLELGGPEREIMVFGGWNEDRILALLANPAIRVRGFEDWGIPAPAQVPVAVDVDVADRIGALPPIHDDSQNVHRREVSEKTNKATEFLLKIRVPHEDAIKLWKDLCIEFTKIAEGDYCMEDYITVIGDVNKWWRTTSCRKKNDYLYMQLLDSLIVYIKGSEHKDELWKRLWEECYEAVGMCCEGHISRLCNVLVGYVDGLDPPVSLGELTQQKMAAIAGQDIPDEEKKRMANEFFESHGIPEAERAPWLEAF